MFSKIVLTVLVLLSVTACSGGGSLSSIIKDATQDELPSTLTAPTGLSYEVVNVNYVRNSDIALNNPTLTSGTEVTYSVTPELPSGLTLNTNTGVISGAPTEVTSVASYVVKASNTAGSTTATLQIAVSENPISPNVVVSRVSGVAPLAVFFDASGTTATGVSKPFHELEYRWNFGDEENSKWSYGSNPNNNLKNLAKGPEAAHVYDQPGVYNVKLVVFNGSQTANYNVQITVTNPDVVFAFNTVCISASSLPVAGQGGCPAGASVVQDSDFDAVVTAQMVANKKRLLFKRGDIFDGNVQAPIYGVGPGLVGAYGSGAKPKIRAVSGTGNTLIQASNSSHPNSTDWRIMDLELSGESLANSVGINGGGSISFLIIYRVNMSDVKFGLSFSASGLDAINNSGSTTLSGAGTAGDTVLNVTSTANMAAGQVITISNNGGGTPQRTTIVSVGVNQITVADVLNANRNVGVSMSFWVQDPVVPPAHKLWDHLFVVDSLVERLIGSENSGSNAIFAAASRIAIMGNLIDTNGQGEHGIRTMLSSTGVYSNNTVKNVREAKASFTMRAYNIEGSSTIYSGTYSEKVVFSDNRADGQASGIGPNNDTSSGRWRNVIFERNWHTASPQTADFLTMQGDEVTVRNNIFDMTGNTTNGARCVSIASNSTLVPIPQSVYIYNNTFYRADLGNISFRAINVGANIATDIQIKNNLVYVPQQVVPASVLVLFPGAAVIESNNTGSGAIPDLSVDPQFVSSSKTSIADYKILNTSFAVGAGTTVKVYKDMHDRSRDQSNMSLGAILPD